MGKKSKRNRSKQELDARPAPALRRRDDDDEEEETKDNLRFQDPFIEEFRQGSDDDDDEEWEDMQEDEDGEGGGKIGAAGGGGAVGADYEVIHSWNPLTGEPLQPGQKLEMDASAYKMHHAISGEWPSLTFDFLRDDLGDHRTRFPHSLIVATGTQAERPQDNQLCIMKLSDLARMQQENDEDDDDILGEEYDNDDDDKEGDDDGDASSSSSDEEIDLDPIVEHYNVKHYGGVNRLRCMPQRSNIIATWSDAGKVNLFNVESILERFAVSQGKSSTAPGEAMTPIPSKPFFSYSKHSTEGYAMDWSKVKEGELVTGDCHGNVHLWTPRSGGSYTVTPAYNGATVTNGQSIEDLQWSPKEATVFASAECNGFVRIFDTRAPGRAMLSHQIHPPSSSDSFGSNDVNVLSWNTLVSNLLATGSDNGILSVWDLRKFSNSDSKESTVVSPLARFSPHKTPITSVEWHPTDESMLAVTDDMGAYIYDLSVEEDNNKNGCDGDDNAGDYQVLATSKDIPPQLLFVHSGSEQFKEVHWHSQISSCLMTTALSGYSIFIPSNL